MLECNGEEVIHLLSAVASHEYSALGCCNIMVYIFLYTKLVWLRQYTDRPLYYYFIQTLMMTIGMKFRTF
jgi:hypothetical protein